MHDHVMNSGCDEEHKHPVFSPRLAFILTNPLRRLLDPPSRLIEQVGIGNNETVVDFGCGPGYYSLELAKRAKKTIGIDISEEMLKKAWKAALKAAVTVDFLQSNGEKIELPSGSVDLVLLVHVFHEVSKKEEVLLEFGRILRRGGRIIIQERTRRSFLGRLLPGPPVVDVSKINVLAERAGLQPEKVEPYGGGSSTSLVTLRKP